MVEQVRPVVLPLFPTLSPSAGTPMVLEGGCAAMVVVPTGPRSRIVPLRSTCSCDNFSNGRINVAGSIAAKRRLRALASPRLVDDRLKRGALGEMRDSQRRMGGPGAGKLQRLINGLAGRALAGPIQHVVIAEDHGIGYTSFRPRLPKVPMQQTVVPRSLALPPEVPSFTGAAWANDWSLGKICGGGGGGGGVLPPPQPTIVVSDMPTKVAIAMDRNSTTRKFFHTFEPQCFMNFSRAGPGRYWKFYARSCRVFQSSGTSVTLDAGSWPRVIADPSF